MGYINKVKVGSETHLIEPTLYVTAATTDSGGTYTTSTLTGFELTDGATVQVKFPSTNKAGATLSVNSTTAKAIYYNGAAVAAKALKANHIYNLTYDGTQWQVVGDLDTDTNTHRPIQVNGTEVLGNNTTALNLKNGDNISITNSSGTVTISAVDKYHKSGSWSGLTYTATAVNDADELKFTIPTGTSGTTVAVGNHNHDDVYAPIVEGGYLPLSGGTMNGTIAFEKVTSTSYPANSYGLSWSGDNDGASIYYSQRAANSGHLVLQTADDNNENIIFRHAKKSDANNYDGVIISPYYARVYPAVNAQGSIGTDGYRWANGYYSAHLYIGPTTFSTYNSDETGTYIEPGGIGLSNKTAQRGYYLRGGTAQYARLYIYTIGTASTAESSSGADDGTQGTLGNTVLELGNATARGAKNTTNGAHNARGLIKMYGPNTGYTQIVSNLDKTTSYNFWLPNYAGEQYAVHAGSASAVGSTTRPVYIAANGRATQTTYAMAGTNTTATTAITYSNDLDTGIWYVNGITGADKTKLYNQADGVIIANKYSNSWITEIFQDYRTGRLAVRGKTTNGWTDWTRILDENGGTITGDLELISGNTAITNAANKRVQWRTSGSSSEVTGYITVSSPDSGRAKLGIHATGDLFFRPGDANNAISTETGTVMTNTSFYPNSAVALMSLGISTRPWNGIYSKGGTFSDNIISNTDLTNTIGTLTTRWGGIHSGYLQLSGPASDPSSTAGARIIFSYDASSTNHEGQPIVLAYSPNDSYRAPYGLKLFGIDGNSSGAWLEVQGNIYAAAFKGNADTATTATGVSQNTSSTASYRKILLNGGDVYTAWNTDAAARTGALYQATSISVQPSTGTILANKYIAESTDDASSTSTGTLIVNGGVGIAKKLYVGTESHFSGAIYTANNTWNQIGDDAYFGDINKAGHVGIQGKNGNTGIFFTTYNQTTKTTGAALTWDGTNMTFDKAVKLPADPQNALEAATKQYVDNSFAANDAMVYKGVLNKDATETATSLKNVPASGYSAGWTYKVAVAGTYANVSCEVGDMVIAVTDAAANQSAVNNAHWTVVQANLVGAVVATSGESGYIAKFSGANTITKGPKIGSSTTTWLNEKGEWSTPTAANVGAVAKLSSTTDNAIVRFNGSAGAIQDSDVTIDDNGCMTFTHVAGKQAEIHVKYSSTIDYWWGVGTANENHGMYDVKAGKWIISAGANNKWSFDGNAATATSATSAGSATTATTATNLDAAPTITKEGTATINLAAATAYTLTVGGKTVVFKTPADSNTHSTTKLIAGGSSATANAAVSSGNVYLRLFDDSTHRSNIQLKAGTAMAITSDANGVITFTSSDTNNAATHTLAKTTKYYVTGTTSATTSTSGDSFDTGVYVTAVEGELSAARHSYNVGGTEKAYTYYNTSDDSIDFVFVA